MAESEAIDQTDDDGAIDRWRRARREVYAAQAILVSADCHPRSAVGHLVAASQMVFELCNATSAEPAQLPAWIRDGKDLPIELSAAERESTAALVETLVEADRVNLWEVDEVIPGPDRLLAHSRQLLAILVQVDANRLGGSDRRRQLSRWLVRAAVGVAVAILLYLALSQRA